MKLLYALFNIKHVHCFSDKKKDYQDADKNRIVVMACNKCGLEKVHI